MALVEVDLPDPEWMRGRWAAVAAVCAARGWGDTCHANGPVWHYDDGGGNWADLHRFGDQAVLVGHDHEYSETYYANAAEYFEEPETDLLAGAPEWWAAPVRTTIEDGLWVGFVYGYENGVWQRAPYDLDDGFDAVGLPAADEQRCRDLIAEFTRDAPGLVGGAPDLAAVAALIAAGGDVTESQVTAVVGSGWDAVAGVAAARRFRA